MFNLKLKNGSLEKWWNVFIKKYEDLVFCEIQQIFNLSEEELHGYLLKFIEEVNNSPKNGTDFFWCNSVFYNSKVTDVFKALALARAFSVDNAWSNAFASNHPGLFDLDWKDSECVINGLSPKLLKVTVALLKINKEMVVDLAEKSWILEQYNNFALLLLENVTNQKLCYAVLDLYDFIYPDGFGSSFLKLLSSKTEREIKLEADSRFRKVILELNRKSRTRQISDYVYSVDKSLRDRFYKVKLLPNKLIDKELFCSQLLFILTYRLLTTISSDEYFRDVEIYFLITGDNNRQLRKKFFLYLANNQNVKCESEANLSVFRQKVLSEFADDNEVISKLNKMIEVEAKKNKHRAALEAKKQEERAEKLKNDPMFLLCKRLEK